jgi:hypothetical protein
VKTGKLKYYNVFIEFEFNEDSSAENGMGMYEISHNGNTLEEPNVFQDYGNVNGYSLDTDLFILYLNTICKAFPNPTIKVEVWNSSAYWMFHDIIHSWQHTDEFKLFVDESLELEAFEKGLLLSLQNGIPLWECMREIHSVGRIWRGEDYDWNDVLKKVYNTLVQNVYNSIEPKGTYISLWDNESLYKESESI